MLLWIRRLGYSNVGGIVEDSLGGSLVTLSNNQYLYRVFEKAIPELSPSLMLLENTKLWDTIPGMIHLRNKRIFSSGGSI